MNWTVVSVSLWELQWIRQEEQTNVKLFLYCHGFNSKGNQQSREMNEVSVGLLMFSICLQPVSAATSWLSPDTAAWLGSARLSGLPWRRPETCTSPSGLLQQWAKPERWFPWASHLTILLWICFVASLFKVVRCYESTLLGQDLSKVPLCISLECLLCRTLQDRISSVFWSFRQSLEIAGHLVSLARERV